MPRPLLAASLIVLCASAAVALSGSIDVSGTVTDTTGAAIVNATVSFVHETDGGLHVEARTDKDGLYQIQLTALTAILEGTETPTPDHFELLQNYPNPFNPSTSIRYNLPQAADVSLTIYNTLGQPVRTLVHARQGGGAYEVRWDGRDADGRGVGAGVYLYQIETESWRQTRKMVLTDGAGGLPAGARSPPGAASSRVLARSLQVADSYAVSVVKDGIALFKQTGVPLSTDAILNLVVGGDPSVPEPVLDGSLDITGIVDLTALLPPGEGPFHVVGHVLVRETPWKDMRALRRLKSVGTWLEAAGNQELESLAGLEHLEHVGGNFIIAANDELESLAGLEQLEHVGGKLIIAANETLGSLSGLSRLSRVGDELDIFGNPKLTNLEGLEALENVGTLAISGSERLTSLDGLTGISHIRSVLELEDNPVLASLAVLSRLTTGIGGLKLDGNPALRDLSGLRNVPRIGLLRIENSALVNLDAFESVAIDEVLSIEGNQFLANLDGLKGLNERLESLRIIDNEVLRTLDGLINLTEIRHQMEISSNPALEDLGGLANLSRVGSHVRIRRNSRLRSVAGLSGLTELPRDLGISDNPSLESLEGLHNVETVTGSLSVGLNSSLSDLDGLRALRHVGKEFSVSSNGALNNLDGLLALTEVGGRMSVWNNDALTSLHGLSRLIRVGGTLTIRGPSTIEDLTDLASLRSVGEDLEIVGHENLRVLTGLGELEVDGLLSIEAAPLLTSLEGIGRFSDLRLVKLAGHGGVEWLRAYSEADQLAGIRTAPVDRL